MDFSRKTHPSLLKEARDGAVRFNKIGEFVDGEQDFFFSSCQVTEGFFPAPKSPGFEKRVFEKAAKVSENRRICWVSLVLSPRK